MYRDSKSLATHVSNGKFNREAKKIQDLGLFCYQEESWSETGYKLKNKYIVNMEEEMTLALNFHVSQSEKLGLRPISILNLTATPPAKVEEEQTGQISAIHENGPTTNYFSSNQQNGC